MGTLAYSAVNLPLWSPAAAAWAEQWIPLADVYEFAGDRSNDAVAHLPFPFAAEPPPIRVGELQWPTGASRFAAAHFAVTGAKLAEIQSAVGNPRTAKTLQLGDGTTTISPLMHLLPSRPIAVVDDSPSQPLYLLVLADDRYWWQYAHGDLLPEHLTSWRTLFERLFSLIGCTTFSIPEIEAVYGVPDPTRWTLYGAHAASVLDAAAAQVGRTVVRNTNGLVVVQTYAQAKAAFDVYDAGRKRVAGKRFAAADVRRAVPNRLRVRFDDAGTASAVTLPSLVGGGGTVAGVYTGVYGVEIDNASGHSFEADWRADYDPGTASGRLALANACGSAFWLWRSENTDEVLAGTVSAAHSGLFDTVGWRYALDGVVTRFRGRHFGPPRSGGRGNSDGSVWARITGPLGGHSYSWVQVDAADADFPDLDGGLSDRSGAAPAYEIMESGEVAAGSKARLWPSAGGTRWVFRDSGGDDDAGSCDSKAWLVGLDTSTYLKLEFKEARGRCECHPPEGEEPVPETAGPFKVGPDTFLQWDGGREAWVSLGMIQTCCGCGEVDFQLDPEGTAWSVDQMPQMLLTSRGCGEGGLAQHKVKFTCTGITPAETDPVTGEEVAPPRPWAEFVVSHTDFCSGLPEDCGNWARYRLTCYGSDCPYKPVPCGACAEGQLASVYKVVAEFDSPYDWATGTYYLTGSECGASGTCEPTRVTASFELTPGEPVTGEFTFRNDAVEPPEEIVFDQLVAGVDDTRPFCLGTGLGQLVLDFRTGAAIGGVTQVVPEPVGYCTGCIDPAKDLYATVNGVTFVMEYTDPGPTGYWKGKGGGYSLAMGFDRDTCRFGLGVGDFGEEPGVNLCGPQCYSLDPADCGLSVGWYATSLVPFLLEASADAPYLRGYDEFGGLDPSQEPGCPGIGVTHLDITISEEPPE